MGTGKRFPQSADGSLEIVRARTGIAPWPEKFDKLVTMHPLVIRNQKVAEKETRLLAFPYDGDWQTTERNRKASKSADSDFFVSFGFLGAFPIHLWPPLVPHNNTAPAKDEIFLYYIKILVNV